jgi:hypothetical protein
METTQRVLQHPLTAVASQIETLLSKLNLELDVAPHDRLCHRDILERMLKEINTGLVISEQEYQVPEIDHVDDIIPDDVQWENSIDWETVEMEQSLDQDSIRERINKRGYSKSKSFIKICRGSAGVPTPHQSGQPRGDCPYLNFTNHLDAL